MITHNYVFHRDLVVLDTETTGVDPVKDRIIELGVTVYSPDGTRRDWVKRFNPGMPIPSEATAVHGITSEDVADCCGFSVWAPKILQALQGRDIAGYNLRRLDLPLLDEEFRRCGLTWDWRKSNIIDAAGIFFGKVNTVTPAEGIKARAARMGMTLESYARAMNSLAVDPPVRPGNLDKILKAVVDGYDYNPGDSDLDNEQPITVQMTLGDYRRASRMQHSRMFGGAAGEGKVAQR